MAPGDSPTPTAPAEPPQPSPAPPGRTARRRAAAAARTAAVRTDRARTGKAPAAASGPRALAWVSASDLHAAGGGWPGSSATTAGSAPPLLTRTPRRSVWRAPLIVPLVTTGVLAATYVTAMLVWPLDNVTPTIQSLNVAPTSVTASEIQWPAEGAGAVSVAGIDGGVGSSDTPYPMASITKVVSSLVMLEELPLGLGEQGPTYVLNTGSYWQYLGADESALPVPDDGRLTAYQLLAGTLIGSAGNYIDRLVYSRYPNDSVYADAANAWLATRTLPGITIVDPSGISPGNTATPTALLALAQRAMAHPVFAEIVGTREWEIPGTEPVENTNALLSDPGVVGIKTGTLGEGYNVLAAKDVDVAGTTVRIYAAVLDQPDTETRWAVGRSLFDQVEAQLQPTTAVAAGTPVGEVTTEWGESIDVVTTEDADLVLWNGSPASTASALRLGEDWTEGAGTGTLTATGPLGTDVVDVELDGPIDDPTPWWKLTHPLELTGIR